MAITVSFGVVSTYVLSVMRVGTVISFLTRHCFQHVLSARQIGSFNSFELMDPKGIHSVYLLHVSARMSLNRSDSLSKLLAL